MDVTAQGQKRMKNDHSTGKAEFASKGGNI